MRGLLVLVFRSAICWRSHRTSSPVSVSVRFRGARDYAGVGADARPKLLILGANDEFRAPVDVAHDVREWNNTRVEVIAGASHFFVGRTDRVVDAVRGFVEKVSV